MVYIVYKDTESDSKLLGVFTSLNTLERNMKHLTGRPMRFNSALFDSHKGMVLLQDDNNATQYAVVRVKPDILL
jgi:hypothetical protein